MDTKGRNRAALPSTEAPVIKCVSCGEPMFAHWQPHPLGGGYWEVTCKSSALECPMSWYTLTAEHYPPENLAEYVLSGMERARKMVDRQKAHRKEQPMKFIREGTYVTELSPKYLQADVFGIGLYLALVAFFAGYAIDKKE